MINGSDHSAFSDRVRLYMHVREAKGSQRKTQWSWERYLLIPKNSIPRAESAENAPYPNPKCCGDPCSQTNERSCFTILFYLKWIPRFSAIPKITILIILNFSNSVLVYLSLQGSCASKSLQRCGSEVQSALIVILHYAKRLPTKVWMRNTPAVIVLHTSADRTFVPRPCIHRTTFNNFVVPKLWFFRVVCSEISFTSIP